MPTDLNNPCQVVAKLIEAINERKQISPSNLSTLRIHLLIFPECQRLLNERGERILGGEDLEYQCSD